MTEGVIKGQGLNFKDLAPPLKKLIVTAVQEQVIKQATQKGLTFVTWPVVGPVVRFILNEVLWYLIDKTVLGLTLLWITLDLEYEVKSVETATARLRDIIDNPDKYSESQMKEIEDNFDEKAIELIHIAIRQF